jgi:hypothetical protein
MTRQKHKDIGVFDLEKEVRLAKGFTGIETQLKESVYEVGRQIG